MRGRVRGLTMSVWQWRAENSDRWGEDSVSLCHHDGSSTNVLLISFILVTQHTLFVHLLTLPRRLERLKVFSYGRIVHLWWESDWVSYVKFLWQTLRFSLEKNPIKLLSAVRGRLTKRVATPPIKLNSQNFKHSQTWMSVRWISWQNIFLVMTISYHRSCGQISFMFLWKN